MRATLFRLLSFFLLGLPAFGANAAEVDHAAEYKSCMALARVQPQEAFDSAITWEALGGAEAARHCQAVALIELGQYAEAARRLEVLAQEIQRGAGFKADLLGQAGQAWLMADQPGQAEGALKAALDLRPDDPDLLLDLSQALAGLQDWDPAIAVLDRVIAATPLRPDAWIFRAAAHRFKGQLPAALADADEAVRLNDQLPDALLERGNIHRLMGNDAAARDDWANAARVGPKTVAGQAARHNLEAVALPKAD